MASHRDRGWLYDVSGDIYLLTSISSSSNTILVMSLRPTRLLKHVSDGLRLRYDLYHCLHGDLLLCERVRRQRQQYYLRRIRTTRISTINMFQQPWLVNTGT